MKKILFLIMMFTTSLLMAGGYQYMDVDSLRVHFTEIRFFKDYGGGGDALAYIPVDKTVDLTGDINDVFSGDVTINFQEGMENLSFGIINIELTSEISIKAHTYDADTQRHIYTTANSIGYLSDSTGVWEEPADYGYLSKDYLYYPGEGADTQETTFMPTAVSYPVDGELNVSLQVETYKCAYYWDGDDYTRHDFVRSWNFEDPSYFPTGTPVIGITYLPLYVIVNETVEAETYVIALEDSSLSDLTALNVDATASFSLVFDSNDEFFIGRTIHAEPVSYSAYILWLPQFISDGVYDSAGQNYSFAFYDYGDGEGWTKGAALSGFTRMTAVGGASATATLTNDDPDNGGTTTVYYKRVR